MARTRRSDVILMDSARKAARKMLVSQVTDTREGLSPHRLATLWKATQVRRIEAATRDAMAGVSANRGLFAAGLAAFASLIAAPMLFRRAFNRNDRRAASIDAMTPNNPLEGADHDRQPAVEQSRPAREQRSRRKGTRKDP